jgi:Pentapeptide repeats (9 copies)
MTDQSAMDWPTCGEDGCIGIRLASITKCLAHASDQERNAALKQLGDTGDIDARGVPISTVLVEQILAAAPHGADNRPVFRTTQFNRATFQGEALFEGATFQGGAAFNDATFRRVARFNRTAFLGGAVFNG